MHAFIHQCEVLGNNQKNSFTLFTAGVKQLKSDKWNRLPAKIVTAEMIDSFTDLLTNYVLI